MSPFRTLTYALSRRIAVIALLTLMAGCGKPAENAIAPMQNATKSATASKLGELTSFENFENIAADVSALVDVALPDFAQNRLATLRLGIARGRNLLDQLLTLPQAQSAVT